MMAKAVTMLTDAERARLFRQLDARTLAEIFPYLDDASASWRNFRRIWRRR